jgi:hypothetical protein
MAVSCMRMSNIWEERRLGLSDTPPYRLCQFGNVKANRGLAGSFRLVDRETSDLRNAPVRYLRVVQSCVLI